MSLSADVDLEEFIMTKDDLSGADIKAVCTEAGLLALRERRMRVTKADFTTAREKVMLSLAYVLLNVLLTRCLSFLRFCTGRMRERQRVYTCRLYFLHFVVVTLFARPHAILFLHVFNLDSYRQQIAQV